MSAQQFLDDFQEKMAKLNNVKRNAQASIAFKEQFTNELKGKLGQINQRIIDLATLVTQLKTTSDTLQTQVNTNNASVSGKDEQIQKLTQEIQALQAEKETMTNQFNQEKQQIQAQMQQQQQKVDSLETQLREITQERDALKNEKAALQTELSSKTDTQVQHVEEINRLTQESEQRLKDQESQLNQRIQECEGKLNDFQNQLREKDEQYANAKQECTNQQANTIQNVETLKNQVNELTTLNNTLLEKIKQASEAIDSAANELDAISNSVPNATTKQEIDTLLAEIDDSIQNINKAVQGQSAQTQGQAQVAPNTPISLADLNSQQRVDITLENLMTMLSRKASQVRRNNPTSQNKYADAINQINSASSPNEISAIIMRNNISVKDGNVSGGKRKTKKNRKQKGGFTYKSTSRRRSITSVTGSKRNSSKRSSR
jgi:chromosome segregation ATPase